MLPRTLISSAISQAKKLCALWSSVKICARDSVRIWWKTVLGNFLYKWLSKCGRKVSISLCQNVNIFEYLRSRVKITSWKCKAKTPEILQFLQINTSINENAHTKIQYQIYFGKCFSLRFLFHNCEDKSVYMYLVLFFFGLRNDEHEFLNEAWKSFVSRLHILLPFE